ncbi:MAG TPA: lipoate--protein ligase family protein [Candidatus Hydrogenedentes bacterium]|nr:lipoate--protein ligase family protein [Candidatus Hydrogenedentota bacterium]HOL76577.1 lipoate--protein ligase family protein [Candidatus Hydrogenedentota bacterium]HPO85240.1 lipoate--protein ligase family protein [Candidatus Hydrogenedentota bacterium]
MRYIDYSFRYPAENLACDEILSDLVERGGCDGVLRFWESSIYFVVVGVSQVVRQEVYEHHCREDGVRIFRRCSAGGTVLQGPGCLNFTLVLPRLNAPELQTIRGSYCYILGRLVDSLQRRGVLAQHQGISDLAIQGMKFSGNAQRRRRHSILHHGTLLYSFDTTLISRYLREPTEQPGYRVGRSHEKFVTNIPLGRDVLKEVVCEAFEVVPCEKGLSRKEMNEVHVLAEEKYLSREWIFRR